MISFPADPMCLQLMRFERYNDTYLLYIRLHRDVFGMINACQSSGKEVRRQEEQGGKETPEGEKTQRSAE